MRVVDCDLVTGGVLTGTNAVCLYAPGPIPAYDLPFSSVQNGATIVLYKAVRNADVIGSLTIDNAALVLHCAGSDDILVPNLILRNNAMIINICPTVVFQDIEAENASIHIRGEAEFTFNGHVHFDDVVISSFEHDDLLTAPPYGKGSASYGILNAYVPQCNAGGHVSYYFKKKVHLTNVFFGSFSVDSSCTAPMTLDGGAVNLIVDNSLKVGDVTFENVQFKLHGHDHPGRAFLYGKPGHFKSLLAAAPADPVKATMAYYMHGYRRPANPAYYELTYIADSATLPAIDIHVCGEGVVLDPISGNNVCKRDPFSIVPSYASISILVPTTVNFYAENEYAGFTIPSIVSKEPTAKLNLKPRNFGVSVDYFFGKCFVESNCDGNSSFTLKDVEVIVDDSCTTTFPDKLVIDNAYINSKLEGLKTLVLTNVDYLWGDIESDDITDVIVDDNATLTVLPSDIIGSIRITVAGNGKLVFDGTTIGDLSIYAPTLSIALLNTGALTFKGKVDLEVHEISVASGTPSIEFDGITQLLNSPITIASAVPLKIYGPTGSLEFNSSEITAVAGSRLDFSATVLGLVINSSTHQIAFAGSSQLSGVIGTTGSGFEFKKLDIQTTAVTVTDGTTLTTQDDFKFSGELKYATTSIISAIGLTLMSPGAISIVGNDVTITGGALSAAVLTFPSETTLYLGGVNLVSVPFNDGSNLLVTFTNVASTTATLTMETSVLTAAVFAAPSSNGAIAIYSGATFSITTTFVYSGALFAELTPVATVSNMVLTFGDISIDGTALIITNSIVTVQSVNIGMLGFVQFDSVEVSTVTFVDNTANKLVSIVGSTNVSGTFSLSGSLFVEDVVITEGIVAIFPGSSLEFKTAWTGFYGTITDGTNVLVEVKNFGFVGTDVWFGPILTTTAGKLAFANAIIKADSLHIQATATVDMFSSGLELVTFVDNDDKLVRIKDLIEVSGTISVNGVKELVLDAFAGTDGDIRLYKSKVIRFGANMGALYCTISNRNEVIATFSRLHATLGSLSLETNSLVFNALTVSGGFVEVATGKTLDVRASDITDLRFGIALTDHFIIKDTIGAFTVERTNALYTISTASIDAFYIIPVDSTPVAFANFNADAFEFQTGAGVAFASLSGFTNLGATFKLDGSLFKISEGTKSAVKIEFDGAIVLELENVSSTSVVVIDGVAQIVELLNISSFSALASWDGSGKLTLAKASSDGGQLKLSDETPLIIADSSDLTLEILFQGTSKLLFTSATIVTAELEFANGEMDMSDANITGGSIAALGDTILNLIDNSLVVDTILLHPGVSLQISDSSVQGNKLVLQDATNAKDLVIRLDGTTVILLHFVELTHGATLRVESDLVQFTPTHLRLIGSTMHLEGAAITTTTLNVKENSSVVCKETCHITVTNVFKLDASEISAVGTSTAAQNCNNPANEVYFGGNHAGCGGQGGCPDDYDETSGTYGNTLFPTSMGSRCGAFVAGGSWGGGAIKIDVNIFRAKGTIDASASEPQGTLDSLGGASGGSILIKAQTIQSTDLLLKVNGASAALGSATPTPAFGGSAGRIAVYATTVSGESNIIYEALGGKNTGSTLTVPAVGSVGTIVQPFEAGRPLLRIPVPDLHSFNVPYPAAYIDHQEYLPKLAVKTVLPVRMYPYSFSGLETFNIEFCFVAKVYNRMQMNDDFTAFIVNRCNDFPEFDSPDLSTLFTPVLSTHASQVNEVEFFHAYTLANAAAVTPNAVSNLVQWNSVELAFFRAAWESIATGNFGKKFLTGWDLTNELAPYEFVQLLKDLDLDPATASFPELEDLGALSAPYNTATVEHLTLTPYTLIPYMQGDHSIQLSLDLWAKKGADTTPFQRGVLIDSNVFHIGASAGDFRDHVDGLGRDFVREFSQHNEYDISGIEVALTSVAWTLYGVPSPEFVSLAANPAELEHSVNNPHIVQLTSTDAIANIEAGTLVPGYIYHVVAAATGSMEITSDEYTDIPEAVFTAATGAVGAFYVHLPPVVELGYQLNAPLNFNELFRLEVSPLGAAPFFVHTPLDSANDYHLLLAATVDFFDYQPNLAVVWKYLVGQAFDSSLYNGELAALGSTCGDAFNAATMTPDALRNYFISTLVDDATVYCAKKDATFDDYVTQLAPGYVAKVDVLTVNFFDELTDNALTFIFPTEDALGFTAQQLTYRNSANWPAVDIGSTNSALFLNYGLEFLESKQEYFDSKYYVIVQDIFGTASVASVDIYTVFDIFGNSAEADQLHISAVLDYLNTVSESDVVIERSKALEYMKIFHKLILQNFGALTPVEVELKKTILAKLFALTDKFLGDVDGNSLVGDETDSQLVDDVIYQWAENVLNSIDLDRDGHTTAFKLEHFDALKEIFDYALPLGYLHANPNVDVTAVGAFPADVLQMALNSFEMLELGAKGTSLTETQIKDLILAMTRAVLRNASPSNVPTVAAMVPSFASKAVFDYEIALRLANFDLPSFAYTALRTDGTVDLNIQIQQSPLCGGALPPAFCSAVPAVNIPASLFATPGAYDVAAVLMRNLGFQEDAQVVTELPTRENLFDEGQEMAEFVENDLGGDLLETAGLASRILSLSIYDILGNEIPVVDSAVPFTFTIPLDSQSTVAATIQALKATRPSALTFTCPSTDFVPLNRNDLDLSVKYGSETVKVVRSGVIESNNPDYLDVPYAIMVRDCGAILGEQEFACVLDDKRVYTYECPAFSTPEPVCVYWDAAAAVWSDEGCSVIQANSNSVTCSCNHMTSFATRFRSFAQPTKSVFASTRPIESGTTVYIAIGVMSGAMLIAWIIIGVFDNFAARRFLNYLYQDKEIQLMRHLVESSGGRFVLDRIQDTWRFVFGSDEEKYALPAAANVGKIPAALYMSPAQPASVTSAINFAAAASNGTAEPSGAALYALMSSNFDQFGFTAATAVNIAGAASAKSLPALVSYTEASSESADSIAIPTDGADETDNFVASTKEVVDALNNNKADGSASFGNYGKVSGLMFKLWLRRLVFDHSWLSVLAPYDPKFTRSYRLLLFSVEFMGSLFFAMVYYNHMHADVVGVLPVLSAADHFLLAFITTLSQLAVSLILSFLLKRGANERFQRRYSTLYEEYRKRNLAQTFLAQFPTEQLRTAVHKYLSDLAKNAESVYSEDVEVETKDGEAKAANTGLSPNNLSDLLMYYTHCSQNSSIWGKIKAYFTPSTHFVQAYFPTKTDNLTPDVLAEKVRKAFKKSKEQTPTFFTVIENFFYVYCTPFNVVGVLLAWAYLAWSFSYIIMFGMDLTKVDRKDFFGAWGINLAYAFLLKEPALITLSFIGSYFVVPGFFCALRHVPFVGAYLLRNAKPAHNSNAHTDILSRRLEQMTVVRATGATNGMSPTEAVMSFAPAASISSMLLNLRPKASANKQSEIDASILAGDRELVFNNYVLSNLHITQRLN